MPDWIEIVQARLGPLGLDPQREEEVVAELAAEYEGSLKVGKCNVDDSPKTPSQFGIRAIPTLIIFKEGKVSEQITGAVSKSQIDAAIKKVI